MNDHKWYGYEGMVGIGNSILLGLFLIAVAIIIHGC